MKLNGRRGWLDAYESLRIAFALQPEGGAQDLHPDASDSSRPVQSTVQYGHFLRSMHQAGGSRSRKAFLRCSGVRQRGSTTLERSTSVCSVGKTRQIRAVLSSDAVSIRS